MFRTESNPRGVSLRTNPTSKTSSSRSRKGAGYKLAMGAAFVAALSVALPGTASAKIPKMIHHHHHHHLHGHGGGAGATLGPIFGCAGGIIFAALAANYRDNRELTADEAWTCGLAFWFSDPQPRQPVVQRTARRAPPISAKG
jgi:hypothetical protein